MDGASSIIRKNELPKLEANYSFAITFTSSDFRVVSFQQALECPEKHLSLVSHHPFSEARGEKRTKRF